MRGFTHESAHNESKEWYTPRYIFRALGIDFDVDPASPGQDVVPWVPARVHYTVDDNGLTKGWRGRVFLNPPYGQDTPVWLEKMAEHGDGIALVFSRTDTQWFHQYAARADAICFIEGRVKFVRAEDALLYADGLIKPKGSCGAGSMLLAYGAASAEALMDCKLGLTLAVSQRAKEISNKRLF